jgi:hypothetical protein
VVPQIIGRSGRAWVGWLAAWGLVACHAGDGASPDAAACPVTSPATLHETYCPPKNGAPEYLCFVDHPVPF